MLIQTITSTYKVEVVGKNIRVEKLSLNPNAYSEVKVGEVLTGDSLLISPEGGMSLFLEGRRLLQTSSIRAI